MRDHRARRSYCEAMINVSCPARPSRAVVLATAFAAVAFAPFAARSQEPTALRLRITQQGEIAIAEAEVRIKDARIERSARSDSGGNVRFEGLSSGLVDVQVRRIGFAAAKTRVRVGAGENAFTIVLEGSIARLGTMRIVSNRPVSDRADDFEQRLLRNEANAVITAVQIDKRNPGALSQMLRGIAGIRIADSMGSTVAVSTRGKYLNKNRLVDCVLRVTLDGVILPALSNIDAVIPKEVYGVEVFFGPARIPPQFGGLRTDAWCGLIAIWTRSG